VSRCASSYSRRGAGVPPDTLRQLGYDLIPVCPEQLGGLPTPRPPAEIHGGDGNAVLDGRASVLTQNGQDFTAHFLRGAQQVVRIAQMTGAEMMIVQRKSPSCSCTRVYDGSFTRRLVDGPGVTVALLARQTGIVIKDLEMLGLAGSPAGTTAKDSQAALFDDLTQEILTIYQADKNWNERVQRSVSLIHQRLAAVLVQQDSWLQQTRSAFRRALPHITAQVADSDTVRFYREVFRQALAIDLLESGRHCRICTYPEGFLDTYLDEGGICSACRTYQENRVILEDRSTLRSALRRKLEETPASSSYDAMLAFSGGKDSVYVLNRLTRNYGARVLCVMDDLNQQTDLAIQNAHRAVETVGAGFKLIAPPPPERDVRRNFLKAGESFCRLCLRSHFIRIYQAAREEKIPLVFFGLSPQQILDCPDATMWSLESIKEVSTPLEKLDRQAVLARNHHRAFQGGFERGFTTPQEKRLLAEWQEVFSPSAYDIVPLMVPFYLFDGYPGEEFIMQTIAQELGWLRPPTTLLHRTNCRWLQPAGMMHRAAGKYHLNYKERAAELRFAGKVMSEEEARRVFDQLNQGNPQEEMSKDEFEAFLTSEFNLTLSDLPEPTQAGLRAALR